MRKTLLFFSIIGIFFTFSCERKTREIPVLDFKELVSDTLILEKDETIAAISPSLTYLETDSGTFLIDFRKLHLVGFNYPEGTKAFERFFFREGPDGLGDTPYKSIVTDQGVYVIDADKKIHLANFDTKVIQSWNLPETPDERLYSNFSVIPNNPISKVGDNLIIADVPYVMNDKLIGYQDWIVRYNLDKGEWNYISFPYPDFMKEFYDDPNLGPFSHYFKSDAQETIVSFPVSDSLMIIMNDKITWKDASPTESLMFKKGKTVPSGEYIVFQPDHSSARYTWITHDPYQKVYLRHLITGFKPEENRSGDSPYHEKIIVLDETLEKVAEIENLPRSNRGFATPDGYYYYLGNGEVEEVVLFAKLDFSKISP